MSSTRDRSVGRRISTFFGASHPPATSPSKTPAQSSYFSEKTSSRGREATLSPSNTSAQLLKPDESPTSHTTDVLQPPAHMAPLGDLIAPPRAPYASEGHSSTGASPVNSRPGSRQDSRAASPAPHPHAVQPHPDGFHNPTHSGTAPGPEEPAPPALLGPPRAKTFSLEADRKLKRRTWMPGSKDKTVAKPSTAPAAKAPKAWITGHPDKIPYDITPLIKGEPLAELWDESGDILVHLFPQSLQKGPSLRIHSSVFSSSPMLTQLAYGDVYSHRRTSADRTPSSGSKPPVIPAIAGLTESDNSSSSSSRGTRASEPDFDDSPTQISLHVPILSGGGALSAANRGDVEVTQDDIDALVAVRNMFSFLLGQSLVATERRNTLFATFLKIADSLTAYGFTNIDGSTYGEVAASSFDQYVDEIGLADVRSSREKTIESIVLGERMRSVLLYNDAFIHAVGKYTDIQEVCQLPVPAQKHQLISQTTRNRMERASIDLYHREKSIHLRLTNFDFPSVFAGVLDSRVASERKQIRFDAWRDAFSATRRHVLSYYKHKFGSWPPKASSKKNNLETGGLNRLVLQELYRDFADIYDLYVDRTSLTVRVNNDLLIEHLEDDNEPETKILRCVFDEYDRAHVPVQPPIPFDVPLLPSFATVSNKLSVNMTGDPKADARVKQKKLNQEEASRTLDAASNPDTLARCKQSPFLIQFRAFEHKQGKNSTLAQMADFRCGMWMFLYAVMQALPLLAVDAPNVRFSHGVEYFLCEPPRSGVPWANPDATRAHGRVSRTWFGVAGGGVVSLPSDLIEHGVEGVYRRSHCWLRARDWSANLGIQANEVINGQMTDEPQSVAGSESNASTLRAPSGPSLLRASAEHARSVSQPFTLPTLPYGNLIASRSAHNLGVPGTPGAMASPTGLAPPGSRPTSPGSARPASAERRRKSVLQFGLEALPLPQGVAPQGAAPLGSQPGSAMHSAQNSISGAAPRSRPITRDGGSGGMTFDDIIKGMEAEKPKKGKKGR